jgi:flagellar basal-body rod protein FlgC
MDLFTAMKVGGSGLQAQRVRLNLATQNLANINTTQTPDGGPYRAKRVVLAAQEGGNAASFEEALRGAGGPGAEYVEVRQVVESDAEPKRVYDPAHPDADEQGYVAMPNINRVTQMTDLMDATRNYKANTMTISAAREMALHALRIGGK